MCSPYAFTMRTQVSGLNVVGYHRQSLGIGAEARRVVRCLRAAGIPVSTIDAPGSSSEVLHSTPASDNQWSFETTLSIVAGDQLLNCMNVLGFKNFQRGIHVGMWYWELMKINDAMKAAVRYVDHLVAGSDFIYGCLARSTDKPVLRFPLTNPSVVNANKSRTSLGLPEDRLVFLCTFDFFSVIERKNPVDTIEAFKKAFSENEGPLLVIKSQNGHHLPADLVSVRKAIDNRKDIIHIDKHVDEATQASYLQSADLLVSLHRSEGLGLHILEALLRDVPVLSTGFSAPIEFLDLSNSLQVDYALVPVQNGNGVYPGGYLWAQPDVQHAAHLMRELWLDQARLKALTVGTQEVRRHLQSDEIAGMVFEKLLVK